MTHSPITSKSNVPPVQCTVIENQEGVLKLQMTGRLSAKTAGGVWQESVTLLQTAKPRELVLDLSRLDYCDMTGIGLIRELKAFQESAQTVFRMEGLRADYQNLFDLVTRKQAATAAPRKVAKEPFVAAFGRAVVDFFRDLYDQIAFVGEVLTHTGHALLNPRSVRWKDVWGFVEKAGADAILLVSMTGFLIGVIMAFQSALPLRSLGSDVLVANVVAFAVLRELGPLITAIILAGRTGSAIAAEIGTMKINEEVNALTTMGLEPVRFLVVSRILGMILLAPLLTILCDFFGMVGGGIVFQSLGYSSTTYMNQILATVTLRDILGGVVKAYPFGLAIAGIGCLRGMQTKTGASAVGQSTTSAVVTSMVMIIILDGIISVIYYVLGI